LVGKRTSVEKFSVDELFYTELLESNSDQFDVVASEDGLERTGDTKKRASYVTNPT
jgi:hypothetical protein